jgi:hypothetical protein
MVMRVLGADGGQIDGRGERIRTFDLLNPIQVRYQAALRPDRGWQSTPAVARRGDAALISPGARQVTTDPHLSPISADFTG